MYAVNDDGSNVDAAFDLVDTDIGIDLIFHSRSSQQGIKANNSHYNIGLEILLRRLALVDAEITRVILDSRPVQSLPVADRTLVIRNRDYPIALASIENFHDLRLDIAHAQGGGYNRRIRLSLSIPAPRSKSEIDALLGGNSPVSTHPSDDSALNAADADTDPYDPTNEVDARHAIQGAIRVRRGRKNFRESLVTAYEGRCVVTGCGALDVLEAAHIASYLGPATNHISNGLLLRADIHTLFDCYLLGVDPDALTVVVAPSIRKSEYGTLHGRPIRPPAVKGTSPSPLALTKHFNDPRWHR
jgi:hypothetical protein